ncbi:NAD(P)/FAD-dependent oxidoreductase [bacterium]|nr:NAD(P)/FAD-dependent oxidoreductase [bacterium]
MQNFDLIVIGAGAAGMFAAGTAAEHGARVLLLEKMNRPGRKLILTGMGRCNITNSEPIENYYNRYGKNGRWLRQAIQGFTPTQTIKFFNHLGVETIEESNGQIFPKSQKAREVVDVLVNYNLNNRVTIRNDVEVKNLLIRDGAIEGLSCKVIARDTFKFESIFATKVIVATGGKSYPGTGSTGDGYRWAKKAGHTLTPIFPALVPLETKEQIPVEVIKLEMPDVKVCLWIDDKKVEEGRGEIEFTRTGLSGRIILKMSKQCVLALHVKSRVEITLDLVPDLGMKELDVKLLQCLNEYGKKRMFNILRELIPERLIGYCLEINEIDPDKLGHQLTADERKRLRLWLKEVRFIIKGHRSYIKALVTSGGIQLKEIHPKTMESKLVKGLYFAGEVLDVDGDKGGYNLQAAFSTGRMAGLACSG